MEIGSFIELQLPKGNELYQGDSVVRLNTGRAAIWHSFRLTGAKRLWLPYYLCESVKEFLQKKNVKLAFYHINHSLLPVEEFVPDDDDAVLVVNYFGIFSHRTIEHVCMRFKHPVVDNSHAFFNEPVEFAYNVYSCRKFIGVADGAYCIGRNSGMFIEHYQQGRSFSTAIHLLERIDLGLNDETYRHKKMNDARLDFEDCMVMSKLTHKILDGTDYEHIKKKRKENFFTAVDLFSDVNEFRFTISDDVVPMVYPLVVSDDSLLDRMHAINHFQGHWWEYLTKSCDKNTVEYHMSRYVIPVTIDQRYGRKELELIRSVI